MRKTGVRPEFNIRTAFGPNGLSDSIVIIGDALPGTLPLFAGTERIDSEWGSVGNGGLTRERGAGSNWFAVAISTALT